MKTISCEELRQMQQDNNDFVLLDVRSVAEWQAGHIDGSINIPLHIIPLRIESEISDKDTQIICCCQSGGRSGQALQFLQQRGYYNVVNLAGGYHAYCGHR